MVTDSFAIAHSLCDQTFSFRKSRGSPAAEDRDVFILSKIFRDNGYSIYVVVYSGHEIQKELGLTKPGPEIGQEISKRSALDYEKSFAKWKNKPPMA